jgi:hypothetical protein
MSRPLSTHNPKMFLGWTVLPNKIEALQVQQTRSTFEKARIRARRRRFLATLIGRGATRRLPELEELVPRPWSLTSAGRRSIPLRDIVGTLDGGRDFDRDFLPKSDSLGDRWRGLEEGFRYASFPPITVYQAGDSYYVVDGHHRVGIARMWRADYIEADVSVIKSLAAGSPRDS